jgi:hypothetical protein
MGWNIRAPKKRTFIHQGKDIRLPLPSRRETGGAGREPGSTAGWRLFGAGSTAGPAAGSGRLESGPRIWDPETESDSRGCGARVHVRLDPEAPG